MDAGAGGEAKNVRDLTNWNPPGFDEAHVLKPAESSRIFGMLSNLPELNAEEIAEYMTKLDPVEFTITIEPAANISSEALKFELIKKLALEYSDREVDITFVSPDDNESSEVS